MSTPTLTVAPLSTQDAQQICAWHYPDPYSVYDFPDWATCVAKNFALSDPERRRTHYRAVYDEQNTLFGFYNLIPYADRVELGLGIRPSSCGKGYGCAFVRLGAHTVRQLYPTLPIYLKVRAWNQRAIECYLRAGFRILRQYYEPEAFLCGNAVLMEWNA